MAIIALSPVSASLQKTTFWCPNWLICSKIESVFLVFDGMCSINIVGQK
jgi:hypothetical protein